MSSETLVYNRPKLAIGDIGYRRRANSFEGMMSESRKARRGWSWWYLLLLVQFVAVLWPPFYNKTEPYLAGMPFFYWYQLLWIIIGAVLTAIVYVTTEE
jgi:hypothetical protein